MKSNLNRKLTYDLFLNNRLLKQLEEKNSILNINTKKYKLLISLCFSFIPYLLLVLLFKQNFIINISLTSLKLLGAVTPVISFITGNIMQKKFFKKKNYEGKLKDISVAKNEEELLTELISNKIDYEKMIIKNKSLKRALQYKDSEDVKNKDNLSLESTKLKISEFSLYLNKKTEELNDLCTRKVLNEQFTLVKGKKINKYLMLSIKSLLFSALIGLYLLFPSIFLNTLLGSSKILLSIPLLIAFSISYKNLNKKEKIKEKIYKEIAATIKGDSDESKNIDNEEIKERIDKITIQIALAQRNLQNLSNAKMSISAKEDSEEKDISIDKINLDSMEYDKEVKSSNLGQQKPKIYVKNKNN